ncbi:hypothetical protein POM88_029630 [Heracleum sosnowskyi]|uniref:Uncharacterized protein n=1 Tax=Heracleum sosnowskyi TaxID=360622 RepID=A0AAD8HVY0_9APIA|nr:hypothetical protein POM88_029630 [Heracleum sosnowskyi]
MIPHIEAASVAAQNVEIEETLSPPTKVLVDPENIHRTVCIDTEEVGMQEEHVVQNSEVHVVALAEGTCNDQVSSFRGNCYYGLWRGYEVDAEFVVLLDQIMRDIFADLQKLGFNSRHSIDAPHSLRFQYPGG